MSFILDGDLAGTYQHDPDSKEDQYLYNIVVFNRRNLSNTKHTLVMIAEQGTKDSLLLFDWAMYTCVSFVVSAIIRLIHIRTAKL